MTFAQACDALNGLTSAPRIEQALYPKRTHRLLIEQGFNPEGLRYVHAAGSKGKGSLSRTAFRLLCLEGVQAGLFTSPHIFDMTERIECAKGMISQREFSELAEEFLPLFIKEQLHFFEALLFMALAYFLRQGCTHVVLEVGVGGRFDPTNFCKPDLVLMGHISLEHKEFLGGTIESIAFDKAGVLKKGAYALSQEQSPEVEKIFRQEEAELHFFNNVTQIENLQRGPEGSCFGLHLKTGPGLSLEKILLRRLGQAALDNFALAAAGVLHLCPGLKKESLAKAAEEIMPFRLQCIGKEVLADTAHNGQSFLNLCEALDGWLGWKDITLYISLLEGKEYGDIAAALKQYRRLWKKIAVFEFPAQGQKASDGKGFFEHLEGLPAEYLGMLSEDFCIGENPVVWAGSFYSIEFLMKILRREKQLPGCPS